MKNGIVADKFGNKRYYKDDMIHREDGPAIINSDGFVAYSINNMLHREDGPAVIYADGDIEYWINGKRHRKDGPAVIYSNGTLEYWIEGKFVDEYKPGFGCFNPKSREEALKWLDSKKRPYFRELYLAEIDKRWPKKKKLFSWLKFFVGRK